jgi:hypothetical protein
LTKYESESTEKETKFWHEIEEFKVPLGEILDESKFYIFKIQIFDYS